MKSLLSSCLCIFVLNFALAALLQADEDRRQSETRTEASPASSQSSASNDGAEVARTKAMGPDVKLANPFRYQPPPLPLGALPPVTPNQGEGASMRVLHQKELEGEASAKQ